MTTDAARRCKHHPRTVVTIRRVPITTIGKVIDVIECPICDVPPKKK